MKKNIIKFLIIAYVIIMVVLPLVFYLFDYENTPIKLSFNIELTQQIITIAGDPFVMKDVTYNQRKPTVLKDKEPYYLEDFKLATDKPTHVIIKDKDEHTIELDILLLPLNEAKKTSIELTGKFDVNTPRVAINNIKQIMNEERELESKYIIGEETNLYIDVIYNKIPITEKIVKVTNKVFYTVGAITKKVTPYFYKSFKLVMKILVGIIKIILKISDWLYKNILKGFQYLGRIYHYLVYERQIEAKEHSLIANALFPTFTYKVGEIAQDIEFECVNGYGKLHKNETFTLLIKAQNQLNVYDIIGPKEVHTDAEGKFKSSIKFGKLTSKYKFVISGKNHKTSMYFYALPEEPHTIKNLKKINFLAAPVGQLLKDAIAMQVFDKYGNVVPNAAIELFERPIDKSEMVKFAEMSTDQDGILRFDYRMADDVKKFFIIAKLKNSDALVTYSLQSQAKRAENIELIGSEERQAIIGYPLKNGFTVKVTDKMQNPATDIKLIYSLQDEESEEISEKTTRTNEQGIATVRFDTPKKVGGYSVVVSCEKFPELEIGFSLLVVPGSVAKVLMVTGNNQTVEWNKILRNPLKVQVVDSLGNPISDADVVWKKTANLNWYEKDDKTDAEGIARASVWAKPLPKNEGGVFANVGSSAVSFKVNCREPQIFQLYLKSKPVVKVFTGQQLPEDIVFVLSDQYGKILPNQKVEFEYMVIRKGVSYLQTISAITNEQGRVSHNFIVSDQGDEINFKGKYFDGKKPIFTWVKIDVLPEDISALNIQPSQMTAFVANKTAKPFEIYVGDNNGKPVGSINLDINCINVPNSEKNDIPMQRVKTNKQGKAFFTPILGKTAGVYMYSIKLGNNLFRNITINALALEPDEIKINSKETSYPVGSKVENIEFTAYDKFHNRINQGLFYYGISAKRKASKNRFYQTKVLANGIGVCKLEMPPKEGKYWFYVADKNFNVSGFTPIRATGAQIDNIVLMDISKERLVYKVNERAKNIFSFRATDRYGNPIRKARVSLDLFSINSSKSEVGVDTVANKQGEGSFAIDFPIKSGIYTAKIYASDLMNKEIKITIELQAQSINKATIIDGDNQYANTNTRLAKDLSLQLNDVYNNPVKNAQVRWAYSVKIKGEERHIEQTTIANKDGIATFNFEVDIEPGIKEIRAYYKKNNKWDYQSFYIKAVTTVVSKIDIIGGNSQSVKGGEEISENFAVKIFDANDAPIINLPTIFQVYSLKEKKELSSFPIEIFTNDQGVAHTKITAPDEQGDYEILVYPKANRNKNVRLKLYVKTSNLEKNKIITQNIEVNKVDLKILAKELTPSIKEVPKPFKINQIVFNGKEFLNAPEQVYVYSNGAPWKFEIKNSSKEQVEIGIKIDKRNYNRVITIKDYSEVIISPSFVETSEQVNLYKKDILNFSWFGIGKRIELKTKDSNNYTILHLDSKQKLAVANEPTTFNYQISSKEQQKIPFPIEIIVKEIDQLQEKIIYSSQTSEPINQTNIFHYNFSNKGNYIVEIRSLLTGQKLFYFVEVNNKKNRH